MNDHKPLARVILTTVDMLRAVRTELQQLERNRQTGIAGRPELQLALQHSHQVIAHLIEAAARLAVLGENE